MSTTSRSDRDLDAPRASTSFITGPTRQVGPWEAQQTLLLQISWQGTDLIRLAATADDPNVGPDYRQETEYWAASNLDPLRGLAAGRDALDLKITSQSCTGTDITAFFNGYRSVQQWTETPPGWSSGAPAISANLMAFYFSMPDLAPQAEGRRVGLTFVVNADWMLAGVAWLKTYDPDQSYAWSPPATGVVRQYLAFNGSSPTSLAIPPATNWWYVLQP